MRIIRSSCWNRIHDYFSQQEWHCTLRGPDGTEFEGGLYHFRIVLPAEYPFRPPSIMMLTPNGRFELNTKVSTEKLCCMLIISSVPISVHSADRRHRCVHIDLHQLYKLWVVTTNPMAQYRRILLCLFHSFRPRRALATCVGRTNRYARFAVLTSMSPIHRILPSMKS